MRGSRAVWRTVTGLPFAAAESKDAFAWSIPTSSHPKPPWTGPVHCEGSFLLYFPNVAHTGTTARIRTELSIWQEVFGTAFMSILNQDSEFDKPALENWL